MPNFGTYVVVYITTLLFLLEAGIYLIFYTLGYGLFKAGFFNKSIFLINNSKAYSVVLLKNTTVSSTINVHFPYLTIFVINYSFLIFFISSTVKYI